MNDQIKPCIYCGQPSGILGVCKEHLTSHRARNPKRRSGVNKGNGPFLDDSKRFVPVNADEDALSFAEKMALAKKRMRATEISDKADELVERLADIVAKQIEHVEKRPVSMGEAEQSLAIVKFPDSSVVWSWKGKPVLRLIAPDPDGEGTAFKVANPLVDEIHDGE